MIAFGEGKKWWKGKNQGFCLTKLVGLNLETVCYDWPMLMCGRNQHKCNYPSIKNRIKGNEQCADINLTKINIFFLKKKSGGKYRSIILTLFFLHWILGVVNTPAWANADNRGKKGKSGNNFLVKLTNNHHSKSIGRFINLLIVLPFSREIYPFLIDKPSISH